MAACIEAENVALATMSLLRPTVVGAGIAYHMFDPAISLRERMRRGWNLELESVREQLNSIDRAIWPSQWEQTAVARYRYLAWAKAHGYQHEVKNERFGERKHWLVDGASRNPPPSELKLAERVLAAVGDGHMGRTVYRFTSSFIHTQPHAFTMFLPAYRQYDPQTSYAVPLGVSIISSKSSLAPASLPVRTLWTRKLTKGSFVTGGLAPGRLQRLPGA